MESNISLLAAFIAGLTGSVHCLVMCGGIAGALGMRARTVGGSAPLALAHSSLYQLGRIGSYALAGAVVGTFGAAVQWVMEWLSIAIVLRVLAGLLLIMVALQLLLQWRVLQPIEQLGASLWRRIAPLAQHTQRAGVLQTLLLGLIWGWLPCGLVYSMLMLGALGGSATHGALTMLAFGLGTLPMMLTSNLLAAQIARVTTLRKMRIFAGVLLLMLGCWTMWVALQHHH
jgi:sulfite exporter TauE/SafE